MAGALLEDTTQALLTSGWQLSSSRPEAGQGLELDGGQACLLPAWNALLWTSHFSSLVCFFNASLICENKNKLEYI